jgi:drug/metabolite transporter (DMT)-like permease
MQNKRPLIAIVLILFAAYTAWAVGQTGLVGFFEAHANPAGMQVLIDLCIALVLVLSWMVKDARRNGRRFWPWLLLTLALGSMGPLSYLLLGQRAQPADGLSPSKA